MSDRAEVLKLLEKNNYLATFKKVDTNTYQLNFPAYEFSIKYFCDKENDKLTIIRESPEIRVDITPIPKYGYMSSILIDICRQLNRFNYSIDAVSIQDFDGNETTLDYALELSDELREKETILMNLILLSTDGDCSEFAREYDVLDGYSFVECLLGA